MNAGSGKRFAFWVLSCGLWVLSSPAHYPTLRTQNPSRFPRRSEHAPPLPSDLRAVFVEVWGRKTYDTGDAWSNTGDGESVGVAERFEDALHDAARDLRAFEGGEPVSGGMCREPASERADERMAVGDAAGVGGEACVVGEVGAIEGERAGTPLGIVPDSDHNGPILRGEELVGNEVRVRVPPPLCVAAGDEHVLRDIDERRRGALGE